MTGFTYSVNQITIDNNQENHTQTMVQPFGTNMMQHDCCDDENNDTHCVEHCLNAFSAYIIISTLPLDKTIKQTMDDSLNLVFPQTNITLLYRPPIA